MPIARLGTAMFETEKKIRNVTSGILKRTDTTVLPARQDPASEHEKSRSSHRLGTMPMMFRNPSMIFPVHMIRHFIPFAGTSSNRKAAAFTPAGQG